MEENEFAEQEKITMEANAWDRVFLTAGQQALFANDELDAPSPFAGELREQKRKATDRLNELLDERRRVSYEEILGSLLELPLVWEKKVVRRIVEEQREAGRLKIEGLGPRERTIKKSCFLVRT